MPELHAWQTFYNIVGSSAEAPRIADALAQIEIQGARYPAAHASRVGK